MNLKWYNEEYLWKYGSSFLQTWHQKHSSQTEQNDTSHANGMTTLLPLVLSPLKLKFPVFGFILLLLWCTCLGGKFEEHCFNISKDIVYSVFNHFSCNLMTTSLS